MIGPTDRAIPWLDTRCSNVIGPEIAPSPSLALGAGESPKTTENFVVYIFEVRESRNTLDCTTCGNVTAKLLSFGRERRKARILTNKVVT